MEQQGLNFGFELDIDECKRSPCRGDESCLNTRGGFRCNRMICPHGYQKEGDGNEYVTRFCHWSEFFTIDKFILFPANARRQFSVLKGIQHA